MTASFRKRLEEILKGIYSGYDNPESVKNEISGDITAILQLISEELPEERHFTSTTPVYADSAAGKLGFNLCLTETRKKLGVE